MITKKKTVLIVEDHPITLIGMKDLINLTSAFQVISTAGDGEEGWSAYLKMLPDVIILDIDIPRLNGIELASRILNKHPHANIIILTNAISTTDLYRAKFLKIRGILLKNSAVADIERCIKSVTRGGTFFSQKLLLGQLDDRTQRAADSSTLTEVGRLTKAEKVVLRLVAENKTTKTIANDLSKSPETIKNHRKNICKKLKLKGNYSLLGFAMKYKYFLLEEHA